VTPPADRWVICRGADMPHLPGRKSEVESRLREYTPGALSMGAARSLSPNDLADFGTGGFAFD
jgi:hypothetical protein